MQTTRPAGAAFSCKPHGQKNSGWMCRSLRGLAFGENLVFFLKLYSLKNQLRLRDKNMKPSNRESDRQKGGLGRGLNVPKLEKMSLRILLSPCFLQCSAEDHWRARGVHPGLLFLRPPAEVRESFPRSSVLQQRVFFFLSFQVSTLSSPFSF